MSLRSLPHKITESNKFISEMCVVDHHKWSCAHGRCDQQGNLKLQSSFVKLLLTQLVKKFPAFTKPKGSTTCWIWSSHCRDYEEYLFWNVTPCIKIKIDKLFGRTYCLSLQGQRVNKTLYFLLASCLDFSSALRWRQYVPPKYSILIPECMVSHPRR
jgi:hypothetical protein